jgi:ATP-binding cassette subfamily B protein
MWVRDHLFELGVDAVVVRNASKTQQIVSIIVAVVVVGGLLQLLAHVGIARASLRAQVQLRASALDRLHELGASLLQAMPAGEVLNRATNDVDQVNRLLGSGVLGAIDAAFALVSALAVMLEMSARLTAASLLPIVTLMIVMRSYGQALYPQNVAAQAAMGKLSDRLQESLAGTKVVRAMSLEASELASLERASHELLQRSLSVARLEGLLMPILGFVGATGAVIVVWYGGVLVLRGELTHGEFIAFWAALARLTIPLGMVGLVTSTIQRGRAGLARVNEILKSEPAILDRPIGAAASSSVPTAPTRGRLEVRGLTFAFGDHLVLQDVSLEVEAGRSLAVVGPVGSGKSTLASLIARILPAPRGTVFIDGVDVCDRGVEWGRKTVGYAHQDAFLFSTTIERNIGLGLPELERPEATERVLEAARDARIISALDALPAGIQTPVGERGTQLSGGQRQRVALARCLAYDAPIVILDDPLSAVDGATARAVLDTIHRRSAGKTLLIITSNVATASKCDRIVVLAAGRVLEEGTWAQLKAKKNGLFGILARSQELRESIDSPPSSENVAAVAET